MLISKSLINFQLKRKIMNSLKTKIAVGQMTSTNNIKYNLNQVDTIIQMGIKENAKMIFLPEACDYIAENRQEALNLAEPLSGFVVTQYKMLAKKYNVWLSFGGIHEKIDDENKIYNSHIIINNLGEIISNYRKLHLFDVKIPEDNIFLIESKLVKAGDCIIPPLDTPIGKLGLCICYDMRFPELAITLRQQNADILTYPSAFTYVTGLAHWEILLRARAIETQCFVIAAAQIGKHNNKRMSYGQSLVIDPWGKIVAECAKYDGSSELMIEPTICTAEIDLQQIVNVRKKMPVLLHKRHDIYGVINDIQETKIQSTVNNLKTADKLPQFYNFGGNKIPNQTVFYNTDHSFAFTNIRCVVPGHVLVSTKRDAKRLNDLTTNETNDLFATVVKVQRAVEQAYNATSSTIAIQDGEDAGQTVQHVHVHILPRVKHDFAINDEIYKKLYEHDKNETNKPLRSLMEQTQEAEMLRKYF